MSKGTTAGLSSVVKQLLEKNQAHPAVITDFMAETQTLDELFAQQTFLLKAWSKQQISEQEARNIKRSPGKKRKKKAATNAGPYAGPFANN